MGMKHHRDVSVRRSGSGMAGIVALILLALGLGGCALNGNVTSPTPVTKANGSTPGAHPTLSLPTLTVAASPGGPGGTGGAKEFCSKLPDITIRPGSNVPVYPGASLHFSQSNGNNAFYGYCTADATTAVHDFYALQLPKSGWSSLQTATIAAVTQISATQCATQSSPQIIVTIAPDTTGTTTTSVSIVVLAGSC
jgi:hypothetical protein